MMNNNFKDKLMEIKPTEEQKARMLSGIKSRMNVPSGKTVKKIFRVAAIAAALCCVLAVTVFAEEIGGFIAGVFTEDEIVGETVKTCVYYDKDEHVEMTVEEVLSDMQTVRMVVLYTALDEEGEVWLSQLSRCGVNNSIYGDDETKDYGFEIFPNFKDNSTVLYGVDWGYGAKEIEEYRTETQRRFIVEMEADDDYWGTDNIILYYMMTDYELYADNNQYTNNKKSAVLDVSTNIEKRVFTLDNSSAPEKLYKPTEAILSPLSLRIRGENLGFYEQGHYETAEGTHYYGKSLEDVSIDSLYLVLNDGGKVNMLRPPLEWNDTGYSGPGALNRAQGENTYCLIYAISFNNPIDMDTIAGIELDGVYYPFE